MGVGAANSCAPGPIILCIWFQSISNILVRLQFWSLIKDRVPQREVCNKSTKSVFCLLGLCFAVRDADLFQEFFKLLCETVGDNTFLLALFFLPWDFMNTKYSWILSSWSKSRTQSQFQFPGFVCDNFWQLINGFGVKNLLRAFFFLRSNCGCLMNSYYCGFPFPQCVVLSCSQQ